MTVHHQSVLKPPRVGTRFPSEICVSILASITRARSQFAFDDEVWVWFTTRIMLSCQSVVNRVQRKCKCNNRWLTCRSSKTKQSAIDTLMGSVSLVSRRHPITSYVYIDDISIPHLQEKKTSLCVDTRVMNKPVFRGLSVFQVRQNSYSLKPGILMTHLEWNGASITWQVKLSIMPIILHITGP